MGWTRWLIYLGALGLAFVLLAAPSTADWAPAAWIAGAVLIVGGWWIASRGRSTALHDKTERARLLAAIDKKLTHFETAALQLDAAKLLVADRKPRKALARVQRAVALSPHDRRAQYMLGQVYLELNRAGEAWEAFDKIYRADPEFDKGLVKLAAATAYLGLHEYAHAADLAAAYLAKEPIHVPALAIHARALWELEGRRDEARARYAKIVEVLDGAPESSRQRNKASYHEARGRLR